MATDFGTLIDNLEVEVDSLHPSKEPYLRQAAVRALAAVSRYRVLWAESSFAMPTIANQPEYTSADPGFPADALDFDVIYTEINSLRLPLERISIERARAAVVPTTTALTPYAYAYHARRLVLVPTPSSIVTLYGDYVADARRDATTGSTIIASDETVTNPWIVEGEDILRTRILMDFYSSPMGSDSQRAAEMRAQFSLAIKEATSQWTLLRAAGFQAPWTL